MKNLKKAVLVNIVVALFCVINANSKVIDSMDTLWYMAEENSGTNTQTLSESANKIEYDFSSGSWVEIYRELFKDADAIGFYFAGSGSSNSLNLQLTDSDGDVAARKISKVTDLSTWTQIVVPFESMTIWSTGTTGGDGVLDTDKLTKIEFAIGSEVVGSGNIAIDKIQSYKINTNEYLLVDSFDFGIAPNELGGNKGGMSDGADADPTITYSRDSYGGAYSLKLDYNFTNWCGYYIFLSSNNASGSKDISGYTHLKFNLKGDAVGNKFKIELATGATNVIVQLASYLPAGTSTSYQEVSIPLADFTGLDLTKVRQINVVFDQGPKTGAVYIDDLRFMTTASYTGGVLQNIDEMESYDSISQWVNMGRDEATGNTATSMSIVSGYDDKALQLTYSFNRATVDTDDWVVMYRNWRLNLSDYEAIKFQYKGTGDNNNIEVKIKDYEGTRFWRKFFSLTDTNGQWQEIVIPMDEFIFFDAEDEDTEQINLSEIKTIGVAVSKNDGGTGIVYIKNLEGVVDSYETNRPNKVIKSLKIDNNPFSPNNDGIKDTAGFTYMLSQVADVKLKIFDLAGKVIFEKDEGEKNPNIEYIIEWDGREGSGDRINNGIYFYQITADGVNKDDEIKHVIAVFR